MDHPTSDLTQRAPGAAAHRVGAGAGRRASRRVARFASRLLTRLVVSVALWVAGGIVLLPVPAQAQEAGGPIVIPGPARKTRARSPTSPSGCRRRPPKAWDRPYACCGHRAVADASPRRARRRSVHARRQRERPIVIPGADEAPAAPAIIRTNFKPDTNGVVTIPAPAQRQCGGREPRGGFAQCRAGFAPGRAGLVTPAAKCWTGPAAVQPVAANAPTAYRRPLASERFRQPRFARRAAATGRERQTRRDRPARSRRRHPPPIADAARHDRRARRRSVQVGAGCRATEYAPRSGRATRPARRPARCRERSAAPLSRSCSSNRRLAGQGRDHRRSGVSARARGLHGARTFHAERRGLWGRMTVGVRCAGERPWTIYLQARFR